MTSARTEQLSKEFRCRSESGSELIVYEYVTVIKTKFVDGSSQVKKGIRRLALRDGSAVNYIDENTFQVIQTGDVLRKI